MSGDGFRWTGEDDSGDADTPVSPFAELRDRIEAIGEDEVTIDSLLANLPSENDADIDHLLDRAAGEPAPADDNTAGGDDRPSIDRSTLDELGLDDLEDGKTSGRPGDSPDATASPFDSLLNRLGQDAPDQGTESISRTPTTGVPGLLCLQDPTDDEPFETWLSVLGDATRADRTNLLLVWLGRDVADRLEELYDGYADQSTSVTLVCRRSREDILARSPAVPPGVLENDIDVREISDPRDLPKLGIAISQALGATDAVGRTSVMSFHSVTHLLQFASFERVFRFLHVLQGRIESVDATAYYHVDPSAHDQQALDVLGNLVEGTIDLAADSGTGG